MDESSSCWFFQSGVWSFLMGRSVISYQQNILAIEKGTEEPPFDNKTVNQWDVWALWQAPHWLRFCICWWL